MRNFGEFVGAVQTNCHISDARHAGDLTLCTYLLKMREFFRWENELPLTRGLPHGDVGTWLHEREQLWGALEQMAFVPLPLEQGPHDPFDSAAVNRELLPHQCVYSAGYGRLNKPLFFLGRLVRHEQRGPFTVFVSSCEYARDLEAPPAMLQGKTIFVRQESVRRWLWEKFEEDRGPRGNAALQAAFSAHGFDRDHDAALTRMTDHETETMILHEIGEGMAGELLGPAWEEMLVALPRSRTEIVARATRDLLADCLSTLPVLIERADAAALHFYFANFGGMRRHLFPEVFRSYRAWATGQSLAEMRAVTAAGAGHWLELARGLLQTHRSGGPVAMEALTDADLDRRKS
jgi:hypothetical protein